MLQQIKVARVSSVKARLYLALDSPYGQRFAVQGNGVDLAMLGSRPAGVHRVNLIQRTTPKDPFWFHSITLFQI